MIRFTFSHCSRVGVQSLEIYGELAVPKLSDTSRADHRRRGRGLCVSAKEERMNQTGVKLGRKPKRPSSSPSLHPSFAVTPRAHTHSANHMTHTSRCVSYTPNTHTHTLQVTVNSNCRQTKLRRENIFCPVLLQSCQTCTFKQL